MLVMWGSGWWLEGVFWMVLFFGLLTAGVVWLARAASNAASRGAPAGARRILDERFASGEISADEYRERLRAVEAGR
jgi:putative membrane protein